jgi:hypothetical protein
MSLERVEKFVYSWCKSSECRRRKRRSMRESEENTKKTHFFHDFLRVLCRRENSAAAPFLSLRMEYESCSWRQLIGPRVKSTQINRSRPYQSQSLPLESRTRFLRCFRPDPTVHGPTSFRFPNHPLLLPVIVVCPSVSARLTEGPTAHSGQSRHTPRHMRTAARAPVLQSTPSFITKSQSQASGPPLLPLTCGRIARY